MDVQLDYVGSLQNAAVVISRLFRGEKRLVFCDSRSRVEELGNELRQLGVSVFLSHSSLSVDERRASEQAFAEAQDCVIVATSTLELGIDVGDLDRVIQIDAQSTVPSFLQRIGRTGRRAGTTRNCLFLATSKNALLWAAALIELWKSGFVEPISPPARPLHLFAQQLMALALQENGIGVRDWRDWINRLPCFSAEGEGTLEEVVRHLLEHQILYSDGTRLSFGNAGENLYGRRHFLELVSVFTSDPVFKVMHGQRELGTVDQIMFLRHRGEEPLVLSMGGRNWVVNSLDWPRRQAFVVPADSKGKSQWNGEKNGMSWHFARAVHSLLTSTDESTFWSSRSRAGMKSIRDEYDFLLQDDDVVVYQQKTAKLRWFTFAGGLVNAALANALEGLGAEDISVTDLWIRSNGTPKTQGAIESICAMDVSHIRTCFNIGKDFLDKLKFNECLPDKISQEILRRRLFCDEEVKKTITRRVVRIDLSD
jgi:ATP-dependent Lhr-like helicase